MLNRGLTERFFRPANLYTGAVLLATVVLAVRLFVLQILHSQVYRLQSEKNRIREVIVRAPRGRIFDREGRVLVANRPVFSLYAVPYELRRNPDLYDRLAKILHREGKELRRLVQKRRRGWFQPVRLAREVDFDILAQLEEFRLDFPGVGFWVESARSYPSGVRASHLLGYLGEITAEELRKLGEPYQMGDVIGKRGLEKEYEDLLRGEFGLQYLEVDALGRAVRTLSDPPPKEPLPGFNLYLTLDLDLQRLAEDLMEGQRGSILMMDLADGGLLAMVSKPDYDPSLLSGTIDRAAWQKLLNDPTDPLYDRSIQSLYPPGSTFKLVLALATLATGTTGPDWKVSCPGYYRLGRRIFRCWYGKGHGRLDLYHAIERSCNVYFYRLGLEVGLDHWSEFARKFGFGRKTGIDLPLENAGIVPDRAFLDKRYGAGKWSKGLILNLAVGQGDLLVTPVQMLKFVAELALKGRAPVPHLLDHAINPKTGEIVTFRPKWEEIRGVPEAAFDVVREGMRLVVNGDHGTGRAAGVPGVPVAGKTGTAQNPHGKDHAWFIGFAPFDQPVVALAVLVENGGGGGAVAAPRAGALLRRFFEKYPLREEKLAAKK